MKIDINNYDFEFPENLIGQKARSKGDSQFLVCPKKGGPRAKVNADEIIRLFKANDCLVINNTKVIPARLRGQKETGGKFEILLVQPRPELGETVWESWVKPGKFFKTNKADIDFGKAKIKTVDVQADGTRVLDFQMIASDMEELIENQGVIPLPPYIEREATEEDKEGYQAVWAKHKGAVAAPTASLHFSEEMVVALKEKGVRFAEVTLHVGPGTFKPVEVEDATEHPMHSERYEMTQESADIINKCKSLGGRIVGVGTTAARVLETVTTKEGVVQVGKGATEIFIYPGYEFKAIDGLITNFHWPKSTLLLLVSALYGRENVLEAYQEAMDDKMKLFSYGDGMLIL